MARQRFNRKRVFDKHNGVVYEVTENTASTQQYYDPERFIVEDIEVICTDDGEDDLGQVCIDNNRDETPHIDFDDLDLTPEELEVKQKRKFKEPVLVKDQHRRTVIASFSVPVVRRGEVMYHRIYNLKEDGFYYCEDFDGLVYKKSIDQLLMML